MDRRTVRYGSAPVLLVLWALMAHLWGVMSPLAVLDGLVAVTTSTVFLPAVGITLARVIAGVALVFLIGPVLVVLARTSETADVLINEVLFGAVYSVPPVVLVFLVLLVFGIAPISPVLVVAVLAMPHFLINVQEGVKDLDQRMLDAAAVAGADRYQLLRSVALPLLVPQLMTAFRSVVNTAWKVIVLAEFFTATSGIGYQLQSAVQSYALTTVGAWTVVLMVTIVAMDRTIQYLDAALLGRFRP